MARRSLRTTLTLWNVAAIVGILVLFGVAVLYASQSVLKGQIDDDLKHRGEETARMEANGPPPGGPDFPGFGVGPPDQGPGPGPEPPRLPPAYLDANRVADIRRPRSFDRDGKARGRQRADTPFDKDSLDRSLKGESLYSTVELDGERVRVYSVPVERPRGETDGVVQLARELRDVDLLWESQLRTLLLLIPLAVIGAAGGAFLLTNRALKPIGAVTAAASEISLSDLSRRLEVSGDDELAEMANTFNSMLGRLERSFEDLQTAYADLEFAYENQKRFTADASHELRTPLTRLRLAATAALTGDGNAKELRDALVVADRASESMARLVDQLLTLARADAGQLGLRTSPGDLRVIVAEALEPYQTVEAPQIESSFADHPVSVQADADHLGRVVTNLIDNALRHTPASGKIVVSCSVDGSQAVISIGDTGEGIEASHLPHLFDRFYRVDAARARKDGGSGLGLAICKSIVEAHGGSLVVTSELGKGTSVKVFLPKVSA